MLFITINFSLFQNENTSDLQKGILYFSLFWYSYILFVKTSIIISLDEEKTVNGSVVEAGSQTDMSSLAKYVWLGNK